jgi:hypothetical protein
MSTFGMIELRSRSLNAINGRVKFSQVECYLCSKASSVKQQAILKCGIQAQMKVAGIV